MEKNSFTTEFDVDAQTQVLIENGNYNKAIESFEHKLKVNPRDYETLYSLAKIYFILEKPQKVIETLQKILDDNKKFDKAYYLMARTYFILLNQYENATKNILKAIELNPTDAFYYSLAAQVFYKLKNYKRSLKLAQDSLNLDGLNYEAHLVMAADFHRRKDYEKAGEHFKTALEKGPLYNDFVYNINLIHLQLARTRYGYKLIKSILSQNPDDEVLQWLTSYAFMTNHPLNKPFVWLDYFTLPNRVWISILIGLVVLIGLMLSSQTASIGIIWLFKWISSIIFIIFIPYQLLVYLILNIYLHFVLLPGLTRKSISTKPAK
jgi:tetratricopeptide (TPR) repeat protein